MLNPSRHHAARIILSQLSLWLVFCGPLAGAFTDISGTTADWLKQLDQAQPHTSLQVQISAVGEQADAVTRGELFAAIKLYDAGKYAEVIAKAEAILVNRPESTNAYELIGASRLKLGEFEAGISALLRASQMAPTAISPLLLLGDTYLIKGDLPEARKYFGLILKQYPEHPTARQGLGLVSEREGKFDEAISHFEKGLLGVSANGVGILVNLARNYNRTQQFEKSISLLAGAAEAKPANDSVLEILAIAYLATNQPAKAVQTYQRGTMSAPVLLGLGLSHRQLNQFPESLKYLKEATTLRSNWSAAWAQLAETQIALADYAGALASLEKARAFGQEKLAAELRMGEVNLLAKDFAKALVIFERLAAANRSELKIIDRLGTAYQAKGDMAGAERVYLEAAKAFPREALPPYKLGLIYDQLGRAGEALAQFKQAASLETDNPSLQRLLSTAYAKAGQAQKAIEVAEAAVAKQPADIEPKLFLAMLCSQLGDGQRASNAYRDVLKTAPDHVITLNNLALVQARAGNFTEALLHARRAVALLPQSGQILDTLGWITYLQGQYGEAEQHLKRSAQLSPQDPSIHYHLGMVQWKLKQNAAALDSLKHAVELSKNFAEYQSCVEMIALLAGGKS